MQPGPTNGGLAWLHKVILLIVLVPRHALLRLHGPYKGHLMVTGIPHSQEAWEVKANDLQMPLRF